MCVSDALRQYIRETLQEAKKNSRAESQLVSAESSQGEDDKKENDNEVKEMSVVSGIVGPTLPLGAETPGKKKKPGWK